MSTHICPKMTKKSLGKKFLAKGNNSRKSKSNATKVILDLYYVKTNPYTKFQVSISTDDWEQSGKPSGWTPSGLTDWGMDRHGQTDRQTNGQTARKPIIPPTLSGFTGRGLTRTTNFEPHKCVILVNPRKLVPTIIKPSTIYVKRRMLYEFWIAYRVGGSIPVIFSYFTEFQPKEKRGMMISALATFWMFGNIIAAGKQSF